jgi:hypothetical protein
LNGKTLTKSSRFSNLKLQRNGYSGTMTTMKSVWVCLLPPAQHTIGWFARYCLTNLLKNLSECLQDLPPKQPSIAILLLTWCNSSGHPSWIGQFNLWLTDPVLVNPMEPVVVKKMWSTAGGV